jgi:hypothetical protein
MGFRIEGKEKNYTNTNNINKNIYNNTTNILKIIIIIIQILIY